MLDSYIKLRPRSSFWQIRVPVPKDVKKEFGREEHTESLKERDRVKAEAKAVQILARLHAEWDAIRERQQLTAIGSQGGKLPTEVDLLTIAKSVFQQAQATVATRRSNEFETDQSTYIADRDTRELAQVRLSREIARQDYGRWEKAAASTLVAAGFAADRDAEWFGRFTGMVAESTVAAIDVENRRDRGELNAKPRSEVLERAEELAAGEGDVAFSKLVEAFMRQWKAGMSDEKETNTEAQKNATFKLFGGYWGDQPIRGVTAEHAADFHDKVRLLDPNWSRSPAARKLDWAGLIEKFGDQPKGLSFATMNRHMRALQALWAWARKRGHCQGENPFEGFSVKLKPHVNTFPYIAWEMDELRLLFDPPPKRADLREVMIVGMFTGMRLDEIASLTWGMLRSEGEGDDAIAYFDVVDAKTFAGRRQVPVHPELNWLLSRDRGEPNARIWPTFNLEGVGKKAGADASREFSHFKTGKGFKRRDKTFHSFRKNVTRIIERAGVMESEWAQVFGHERGFTYGTYNPDGITMARKAEIIGLISYPKLAIPHPENSKSD